MGLPAGALMLMIVAGCTNAQSGTPSAGATVQPPSSTTTRSTAPPATTSKPPSARPRSIDISGTDGCQILKQIPLTEFGLDAKEARLKGSLVFKGVQDCLLNGLGAANGLSVTAVPNVGMDRYLDTAGGTITRTTVAGFPAFQLTNGQAPAACFGGVDVADGQMLYVQFNYIKTTNQPPQAQLCESLQKVQAAAMKVLGAS